MKKNFRYLGTAKRVRVRMPLLTTRSAWDCRPYGFGRIVGPIASGAIEIAPGVDLNLATGDLLLVGSSQRRSA